MAKPIKLGEMAVFIKALAQLMLKTTLEGGEMPRHAAWRQWAWWALQLPALPQEERVIFGSHPGHLAEPNPRVPRDLLPSPVW